jgi:hypothetical protein
LKDTPAEVPDVKDPIKSPARYVPSRTLEHDAGAEKAVVSGKGGDV